MPPLVEKSGQPADGAGFRGMRMNNVRLQPIQQVKNFKERL